MSKDCKDCPGAALCGAAAGFLESQVKSAAQLAEAEPRMRQWRGEIIDGFEGIGALPDFDDFGNFLAAERRLSRLRSMLVLNPEELAQVPQRLEQVNAARIAIEAIQAQKACMRSTCLAQTMGAQAFELATEHQVAANQDEEL